MQSTGKDRRQGFSLRGDGPAEQAWAGMSAAEDTYTCSTNSTTGMDPVWLERYNFSLLPAGMTPPCGVVALLNRAGAGMSGNAAARHLYSTKLASASLTAGQQGPWHV